MGDLGCCSEDVDSVGERGEGGEWRDVSEVRGAGKGEVWARSARVGGGVGPPAVVS